LGGEGVNLSIAEKALSPSAVAIGRNRLRTSGLDKQENI